MVSIVASIKDCSFDEMYSTYKFINLAHKVERFLVDDFKIVINVKLLTFFLKIVMV